MLPFVEQQCFTVIQCRLIYSVMLVAAVSTSSLSFCFFAFNRSSVNLPLMAAPSTPLVVPGNFRMHVAIDRTNKT